MKYACMGRVIYKKCHSILCSKLFQHAHNFEYTMYTTVDTT